MKGIFSLNNQISPQRRGAAVRRRGGFPNQFPPCTNYIKTRGRIALIEVQNLTYTYSKSTPFEHKALDGVSFRAENGEFIGVIGHTGSGKSTLMQMLNGLLKPDSGAVLLDGRDIHE
jgi:ABC-type multidrug transport system fused ATPase/permease subunit